MLDDALPRNDERHEPRLTIWGAAALFFLRLRELPQGEYVIHLDKSHARWRWRVAPVGVWERQQRDATEN